METTHIRVLHYYNHPILYPFMPYSLFKALEDAFINNLPEADVSRDEFEDMIEAYFNTLRN